MESHQRVGWAFFYIFLIALVVEVIAQGAEGHLSTITNWLIDTRFYYLVPLCVLFWLTTKFKTLRILHVVCPLAWGIFDCFDMVNPILGLLSYAVGLTTMIEYGMAKKHFVLKCILLLGAIAIVMPTAAILHPGPVKIGVIDLVFDTAAFFVIMYVILRDRLHQYAKVEKPKLVLSEKGLNEVESWLVHQTLLGATAKEIHAEIKEKYPEVSALSTVYAYRTRALEKLGYPTVDEFLRASGEYQIV